MRSVRIAHTGDLHITEGLRFAGAVRCLDFIARDAAEQKVDVVLVGGDLAGTQCPHRATPAERNALADFFQACAETAPVVILVGNHDQAADAAIYSRLVGRHPILVVDRPHIVRAPGASIYCLPFPSKAWAVAGGAVAGDITAQKGGVEELLRTLLVSWRIDAETERAAGRATVGLFHINIGGSVVGGGEVLIGREIELAPHDLAELGFDAGCLAHIHKRQEMAPKWWYSGSPYAQNFGEAEDPKGYHLVEIDAGERAVIEFRPTPSPKLVTVRMEWGEDDQGIGVIGEDVPDQSVLADAEVRLIVMVHEEHADACDTERLAEKLRADGALSVRVERRILPKTRVRSDAISRAVTLEQQLAAFWDSLGDGAPSEEQRARCLEKLAELGREESLVATEAAA